MIKEKIEQYLKSEFAKRISNEQYFFFQKGQDALQKWLNFSVSNEDKADLERLASDYDGLQVLASQKATINDILNLLFEIVSYCDSKAKDKTLHNQYNDNRTLAMAYVRMNHWIEKLIIFKFSPNNIPVGSILNAINYFLVPTNNATILSENHRAMISKTLFVKEYVHNDFIKDLEQYFLSYQIVVSNPKNYTYLLSCIIYNIKKEWLDDVIGLMASDNTVWKDNLINDMNGDDCTILWNSKRPTGTNNTLKMLRNKINNGEYFKLFYSVHGSVQYVAEIIDFVENDNQLKQKNWPSKFKKIVWYQDDFAKYKDDNKSARIVFLAKNFYKINAVPASEFEVYKDYSYPTQDNLAPIISEPDMTIIPPTTTPLTIPDMRNNNTNSLNQILYGPPGTGKTYNTINKAISIINPDFDLKKDRNLIKEEYERLVLNNQISFTTFHQSMSYEDFIEGIKPIISDENEEILNYEIKDGLFKIACANAAYMCYKKYQKSKTKVEKYTFDDLHDAFTNNIEELLKNGTPPTYKTLTGKDVTVLDVNKNASIRARAKNSIAKKKPAPLTKENLQKLYDKFSTIEEIKSLKQVKETVEITPRITEFYAVFRGLKVFEKNKFVPESDLLDENIEVDSFDVEEIIKKFNAGVYKNSIKEFGKIAEPVVLIIDEINRGNISQIFGELITLIEEDKRLGEDEALEVMLPYSKEKFGVPPNLYIVGTMNTADRSVQALDTALRRRFSFEEMPPRAKVVAEKEFSDYPRVAIMEKINNRIEVLLDRNHTLGHAYFIKKIFKSSFENEIIPLLQEYFYNDYGKIGLVLGKGFVREKAITAKNDKSIFADFDTKNDVDINKSYELIPFLEVDFDTAIQTLLV
ncbi:McrB family protein [Flavobacterium sp. LB3P21]|uniref:McrB family protein n=1 Tax=Flavobacterium sp. LB3P21 TaxID=3401719 RepID=UPI003AAFDFF2